MLKRTTSIVGCVLAATIGFFGVGADARTADTYTFATIDVPNGGLTTASGIDVLGRVVGHFVDGGGTHGFVLANGEYSTLDFPGAQWTAAYGINTAGQIVGSYGPDGASGRHGFLLSNGRFSSIDVPGSSDTVARGVNNQGQIVGDYMGSDGARHGFLLSSGTYSTIEVPKTEGGAAGGINDVGQIAGRAGAGANGAGFLFAGGQYSRIQVPDSAYTEAWGVNNRGEVVGQVGGPDAPYRGFRAAGGSYLTIEVPGLPFSWDARGISDLGEVVGSFTDNDGKTHGYRATPVALRVGPADPRLVTDASRGDGVVGVGVDPTGARGRNASAESKPQGPPLSPTLTALATALSDLETASGFLKRAQNQSNYVKTTVSQIGGAVSDVNAAIRWFDSNRGDDSSTWQPAIARPDFTPPPKPTRQANANLYRALDQLRNAFDKLAAAPRADWGGFRARINEDIAASTSTLVAGIISGNKRFEGRGERGAAPPSTSTPTPEIRLPR